MVLENPKDFHIIANPKTLRQFFGELAKGRETEQNCSPNTQFWLCMAFFLAFAIKTPMVPFHTWLPDAHSEAPTAGSVILIGMLLKMGGYGFLRFCLPMFPEASANF